jgi:hypothetical protein
LTRNGIFTLIPPITVGTLPNVVLVPEKINNWGSVVGEYVLQAGQTVGFKRWKTGGLIIGLDNPWIPLQTRFAGINDSGTIVGTAGGNYGPQLSHGLIYQNGSWTQVDYPGMAFTRLAGISNSGVIIGNASPSQLGTPSTPFVYKNGVFEIIPIPPAFGGTAHVVGISLREGLIVGYAQDQVNNRQVSFIAECN